MNETLTLLLAFPSPWQTMKAGEQLAQCGVSSEQIPTPTALGIPCEYALLVEITKNVLPLIRETALPSYIFSKGEAGNWKKL